MNSMKSFLAGVGATVLFTLLLGAQRENPAAEFRAISVLELSVVNDKNRVVLHIWSDSDGQGSLAFHDPEANTNPATIGVIPDHGGYLSLEGKDGESHVVGGHQLRVK
jgi:hypothetical protein